MVTLKNYLPIANLLSKVFMPIFISTVVCIHTALHLHNNFFDKLVGVKQYLFLVILCVLNSQVHLASFISLVSRSVCSL